MTMIRYRGTAPFEVETLGRDGWRVVTRGRTLESARLKARTFIRDGAASRWRIAAMYKGARVFFNVAQPARRPGLPPAARGAVPPLRQEVNELLSCLVDRVVVAAAVGIALFACAAVGVELLFYAAGNL